MFGITKPRGPRKQGIQIDLKLFNTMHARHSNLEKEKRKKVRNQLNSELSTLIRAFTV